MSDFVAPIRILRDEKGPISEKSNIKVKINPSPLFNQITYMNDEYGRDEYFELLDKLDN